MKSTSIIKAAMIGDSRVTLGAVNALVVERETVAQRVSEAHLTESALRAQFAQELEAKLTEVRERAREEGFNQGYREGMVAGHADGIAAGKESLRAQLAILEGLMAKADEALAQFWSKTTSLVEGLTLESVCHLLGEFALEPDVVMGMVHQVVEKLHDDDVLRIRINPTEHAKLMAALDGANCSIRPVLGGLLGRIVVDPALAYGGCVVETIRGEYCATLDVQLARLYSALKSRRQHGADCA